MTQREFEEVVRKLGKRGFHREGVPLVCEACNVKALVVFQTKQSTIGGRDIEICADCGVIKSYRRVPVSDTREEDKTFDLTKFLA